MAAILVPNPHHPLDRPRRPDLRLVGGGAVGRPHRTAACYRRRRIAAALLAAVVLVGLIAGSRALLAPLAEPAPAGPAATSSATPHAVVVQPGDTIWTIARRAQPDGDVRPLVDRLVAAHGSGPLTPGERISVPN
jgi:hypothetical protein